VLAERLSTTRGAVPGMRAHLEGCPACREDHDALAALLGQMP